MAYQSFFNSGSGSATTPKSSGGYQSFFGFNVKQAPSSDELASIRKQQAEQNVQDNANQQKQKEQSQQNSLLGKIKGAGKNIVEGAKTTGEKALNTVTAGGAGLIGLGTAGVQAATGDTKSAKTTLAATQQTTNEFLDKGVGNKGGYISSQQANSRGGGKKGYVENFVKPVAQGATDIAPYVIPVGKVAKGASLATKVVRGAVDNAAVNGIATTANEALQGRLTKGSDNEVAKSMVTSALIGAAAPLLHNAVKEGAAQVSIKDAKTALNNTKVNTILKQAEASNKEDVAAKAAPKTARVNTLLDVGRQANTQDTTTAIGDSALKKANTVHIPVESPGTSIAGKTKIAFTGAQRQVEESAPATAPIEQPKVNSIPVNVLAKSEAERPVVTSQSSTSPPVPTTTTAVPGERETRSAPVERLAVERTATAPDRGTSKIAANIQEKAVARGLKNDFGEAGGYDRITIADQAAKAVKVANDRPLLESIINGEKPLPDGLRATALIKAVEEHPELGKDVPLLNRLSQAEHITGESSRSAQALRIAADRTPHSPVEAIRSVRKAREAAVERKTGKSVAKAQDSELEAIRVAKTRIQKPTKETFAHFVESLKC